MRQLFADNSPLLNHTKFPLWITNGTMQVLARQRAHIKDGWWRFTELLKLVPVVFRMLNIQHSNVKEICITVFWDEAWSLYTSVTEETAASTLTPWHWMFYIHVYILLCDVQNAEYHINIWVSTLMQPPFQFQSFAEHLRHLIPAPKG